MLIVGELINSSIEKIAQAVKDKHKPVIQEEARKQVEAGANYIDVNAGIFLDEEIKYLPWLVETVQEVVDKPLCIDTSNAEALGAALKVCRGRALVNSITAEKRRYEAFLPLIKQYGCSLVALCVSDSGISPTIEGRLEVANQIISSLLDDRIAPQNIYIDPAVEPVALNFRSGVMVLEIIRQIKAQHSEVKIIMGISNISFGLPCRRQLNRAFMGMSIQAGLDAAILDPCDSELMALIFAATALLGQDEFCVNYINAYREGRLT